MIDPADLRDVFDRAASLPPQDRAAFLARACGDNLPLRQEVERLLAADARAGSLFSGDSSDGDSGQRDTGSTLRADLAPGTRLGPYVLVGSLGAGGMGEVYKARDTRLDRSVAIKVLPANLVASPEARQRFEREAKAAAALAHAHICRLLDVGRHGDTDYLVMELLDGETLAARLQRGKLPLRQALTYGTQVAGALVVAHRAGIVHRDLKPGNIMLTPDGAVLLDFGLARHTAPVAVDGPTATVHGPITRTGVILGTVQYMAPEQLEGREADARTDIFALGAVLYEMVTGRRAFEGSTNASVIGNILHADPPSLTSIESTSPPALDRLVRKCLAKSSAERWQSASEVKAGLEALTDASDERKRASTDRREASLGRRVSTRWRLAGSLIVVAALVVIMAGWSFYRYSGRPRDSQPSPERKLTRLTFNGGGYGAFSPDDRFIVAHCDNGHLCVQPVAGGNLVQITDASAQDILPDWSPDGSSIAFGRVGQGVFLVSPLGGQERQITTFGGYPLWSPDGKQLLFSKGAFGEGTQLFLVAPDQTPRQILSDLLDGGGWGMPAWHPDGRITIAGTHRTEGFGIYTASVQDGHWTKTTVPPQVLASANIVPGQVQVFSWDPTGRFSYATLGANVWRLQLDAALQVTASERITTGPGSDWYPRVSHDGKRLLFTIITGDTQLWSFPYRANAGEMAGEPIAISEEDGGVNWASLSPDGRRLTYYYQPLNSDLRQSELRLGQFPFTSAAIRIPADRYVRMASAWSHQGNRLALQAAELSSTGAVSGNLLLIRDQGGTERVVGRCRDGSDGEHCGIVPVSWTPDDSAILATTLLAGERRSRLATWSAVMQVPIETPQNAVSDADWNISQAAYSPDGRWLAFSYGEAGKTKSGIAIVASPANVPRSEWHLFVADGYTGLGNPSWSPNERSLYFTSTSKNNVAAGLTVWRVPIVASTGTQAGPPAAAFPDNVGVSLADYQYYPKLAMSADRVVLPKIRQKQAVWMLDNVDR